MCWPWNVSAERSHKGDVRVRLAETRPQGTEGTNSSHADSPSSSYPGDQRKEAPLPVEGRIPNPWKQLPTSMTS